MSTKINDQKWKICLLATIISLMSSTVALAASGDLDTTFGGDGRVTTNFGSPPGRHDGAFGIAVQADGKIVAAGFSNVPGTNRQDVAITRYNTDGSLDTTFHTNGKLITDFGGGDYASDVAIQANGKIVVVGRVCDAPGTIGVCDAALARYNSDGTLDTTFSGDGKQTTDFGSHVNTLEGVAIQSNGKIVAVGIMNSSTPNFAVYRYLSDGSLDPTFGGNGKVSIGFGIGRQDYAYDLAIQSDGKIIVVGKTGDSNGFNNNFAIARLNSNGTLDIAFSGDGKQVTNFGGDDWGRGVALQSDGKIVVAGMKLNTMASLQSSAVVRYNLDGSLDTTFNGMGKKVFTIIAGEPSGADGVTAQSDGKILVGGSTGNSGQFDFALVRLRPGGSFDTAFGGDGKVIVDFGGYESGLALAVQPLNGRYVVAGETVSGIQQDFALARVLP